MARLIFAASSFVALGRPRQCLRALSRAATAVHESDLAFVQQKARQFVKLMETGGAIDSGRRGPALLSQPEELRQWARAHRNVFDPYCRNAGPERLAKLDAAVSIVLPVVAERDSSSGEGS